jgi:hypothetical protein
VRILGLSGVDDPDDAAVEGHEGRRVEGEEDSGHRKEKENLSPGQQVAEDGALKRRASPKSL